MNAPHHVTDEQIKLGIIDLIEARDHWTSLTAIRADWAGYGDVTRERIDAVLIQAMADRELVLIPESNQKTLTQADRDAALWIGGEYRHVAITYRMYHGSDK